MCGCNSGRACFPKIQCGCILVWCVLNLYFQFRCGSFFCICKSDALQNFVAGALPFVFFCIFYKKYKNIQKIHPQRIPETDQKYRYKKYTRSEFENTNSNNFKSKYNFRNCGRASSRALAALWLAAPSKDWRPSPPAAPQAPPPKRKSALAQAQLRPKYTYVLSTKERMPS